MTTYTFGETPEEEFEEVAERAYKSLDKMAINECETSTQLIKLLEEDYFMEKAYPNLLPSVAKAFERMKYWQPTNVVVEMPKEQPVAPEISEEKVQIDLSKFKKEKKVKQVKLRIKSDATDDDLLSYIDSKPSKVVNEKIYKVTPKNKLITKEIYFKKLKNLQKSWKMKRTNKQG
jgi:hypothetical protein